jgi:aldehyde:ferredoxin oxidoreductase
MFGYCGKILYINLRAGSVKKISITNEFCKKFIGGSGFITKFLLDLLPPRVDPLSHENVLIFATGPFAGTIIPTGNKYAVGAKSPLTGFIGDAVSSSFWAQQLKQAGFDAVIITERAKKPTWILIDDDEVTIRDAEHLWGKFDTFETEKTIKQEVGDDRVSVATIGLGGENLVRYACICNDGRQAGRSGVGAVMGSKNLKAIAVRGSKSVDVPDLDKLFNICAQYNKRVQEEPGTRGYLLYGTNYDIITLNEMGILPTRNWKDATFEHADKISGEFIFENYIRKHIACSLCPISCAKVAFISEGPYSGAVATMDYEPTYALGSNCGIGYYPAIVKGLQLCDSYGLDAISTGLVIGWAMECYERGIFTKDDTGGLELEFGNHDAMIKLIHLIARREGIGKLLAEGVRLASKQVGKGTDHFAMHVKGLELAGFDARGAKATGFGYAVCTRGGCHVRSGSYDLNVHLIVGFREVDFPAEWVMETEDFSSLIDSLIICRFIRGVWKWKGIESFNERYAGLAELYWLVTGFQVDLNDMRKAGERITNLKKLFNIREGWKREDDTLPPRIMYDPIPSGPQKGLRITPEELESFLNRYYKARGWDMETGIPTIEKMTELGLAEIATKIIKCV